MSFRAGAAALLNSRCLLSGSFGWPPPVAPPNTHLHTVRLPPDAPPNTHSHTINTRRDGRLALAATRGDGREGEDVTHNAATGAIAGLPPVLQLAAGAAAAPGAVGATLPREIEIRGEVYLAKSDLAIVSGFL